MVSRDVHQFGIGQWVRARQWSVQGNRFHPLHARTAGQAIPSRDCSLGAPYSGLSILAPPLGADRQERRSPPGPGPTGGRGLGRKTAAGRPGIGQNLAPFAPNWRQRDDDAEADSDDDSDDDTETDPGSNAEADSDDDSDAGSGTSTDSATPAGAGDDDGARYT